MIKLTPVVLLFILCTTVTGAVVRIDSVSVDSVWNADSSWYDSIGELHQRYARDLFLSFYPASDSLCSVQTSINMSLDNGITWDSTTSVFRVLDQVRGASFPVNHKYRVHVRVVGPDRPSVAFQVNITGILTDIGKTMRIRVELPPDSQITGQPVINEESLTTIVNFPFKGGMSPDGSFLATSYIRGYLYNTHTDTAYEVNPEYQIMNASISPDQVNYPGCMLWLNFSGTLNVNVPDQWKSSYPTTNASLHDRLTVSDTSNTVRWFVTRPSFIGGELQDPEWSYNPGYITTLGTVYTGNTVFSGYAVRISDKAWLQWNDRKLRAQGDAYLWLPDSITSAALPANSLLTYDTAGLVDKRAVRGFFGTDSVKIAFVKPNAGGLFRVNFVDFDIDTPVVTTLAIATDKGEWNCENPQISPDGKWVAYHAVLGDANAAYIQRLSSNAQPVLVKEGGSMPHWWKDPASGNLYIIFNTCGTLTLEQFTKAGVTGTCAP